MSTSRNRAKRMICALTSAAAAVSVALFVGVGTAHATIGVFPSEPHPWGVTIYVQTDNPVDSWCTYNADWFHRPFYLPANQMAHIDIHGIPLNREWNVNVSCRNGESWQGNIHY